MIRVCFHGAESTGKSVMARKLAHQYGCPWIPEFGRAYCESLGTDLKPSDLAVIAEGQDAAMREASASNPRLLILDTDPLMTAAWSYMMFGVIPDAMLQYEKAEIYLLFEPDVPWVADGTRMFGLPDERARFQQVAEDMLMRTGVPFTRISGDFNARETQVRAAINRLLSLGL